MPFRHISFSLPPPYAAIDVADYAFIAAGIAASYATCRAPGYFRMAADAYAAITAAIAFTIRCYAATGFRHAAAATAPCFLRISPYAALRFRR